MTLLLVLDEMVLSLESLVLVFRVTDFTAERGAGLMGLPMSRKLVSSGITPSTCCMWANERTMPHVSGMFLKVVEMFEGIGTLSARKSTFPIHLC
jgi:hypothetical protein